MTSTKTCEMHATSELYGKARLTIGLNISMTGLSITGTDVEKSSVQKSGPSRLGRNPADHGNTVLIIDVEDQHEFLASITRSGGIVGLASSMRKHNAAEGWYFLLAIDPRHENRYFIDFCPPDAAYPLDKFADKIKKIIWPYE